METNRLRSPFLRAMGIVITLLGIAPLTVLLRAPAAEGIKTIMPLSVCLLCYPISLTNKRLRILLLAIACALGLSLGIYAARTDIGIKKYVYLLITLSAPAYVLPSIYRMRLQYEISIGIAAILLSWLLLRGDLGTEARPEVFRLAVVFLPLMMLYINLSQIEWERRAQKSGQMGGMKLANAALTGIAAALAFLLANARAVWEWLKVLIKTIISLIISFFALGPQTDAPPNADGPGGMMQLPASDQEPSKILKILEIIAFAAAALFVVWILVKLLKRIPAALARLMRRIREIIRRYMHSITAEECGYVDTSESIGASESRIKRKRRFRKQSLLRWEELDNRRKIRAAYRYAVGQSSKPYLSATENLNEALNDKPDAARVLAQSYDRARYSEHDISDAEVSAAQNAIKPEKR